MNERVKLGEIIKVSEDVRDAIHLAVASVVCGEESLMPGQHVGIDALGAAVHQAPYVGIVDPFLNREVTTGQRFFLCLYPGSIVSLRHQWAHPAFADSMPSSPVPDVAFSEKWLREYAKRLSPYDTEDAAFTNLINGIRHHEIFAHGSDLHGLCELEDSDDLRKHAERYLNITICWGEFEFSCSC